MRRFPVEILDDALLDGTQTVTITAMAVGFASGMAQLEVTDYETLTVSIAAEAITESDVPTGTTLTVSRSNWDDLSTALEVILVNGDPSESYRTGQYYHPGEPGFGTRCLWKRWRTWQPDGPQLVEISAEAAGYVIVSDAVWVEDSDGDKLWVEIPIDTVDEAVGGLAMTATVGRSGDTTDPLVVLLTTSHPR